MYLTKKEVATRINVSLSTVNRILIDGKLPFIRVSPKVVRIQEIDFQKWVKECRVTENRKKAVSLNLISQIGLILKKPKKL